MFFEFRLIVNSERKLYYMITDFCIFRDDLNIYHALQTNMFQLFARVIKDELFNNT